VRVSPIISAIPPERIVVLHDELDLKIVCDRKIEKHVIGVLAAFLRDLADGAAFILFERGVLDRHDDGVAREVSPLAS
jgi:hypothetical protein